MTMPFRQEIELLQNYPKHKTFTVVMANNNDAQDVVTLSGTMEECNKISFIVEEGDVYVGFDEDATTETMLIPKNEGYFDDAIYISTKVSLKRKDSSGQPRIRGIMWGR